MNCEIINGHKWFYYLVPRQQKASLFDEIGDPIFRKFIVCLNVPGSPKIGTIKIKDKHLFAAFDSYLDFLYYSKNIDRNRWWFFEVILGSCCQKLYFDIDIPVRDLDPTVNPDSFANQLICALVGRIVDSYDRLNIKLDLSTNILLFSSNSEAKRSYHLIVNGYCVTSNLENKILAEDTLHGFPEQYLKFIDLTMYSAKQQLRLLGSQKPNSGRPKIFIDTWAYGPTKVCYLYPEFSAPDQTSKEAVRFTTLFAASCVTVTTGCQRIGIKSQESPKCLTPKYQQNDFFTEEIFKEIIERLDKELLAIFSIGKIEDNLILLLRTRPAFCSLCKRVHENENAFLAVSEEGKVYFHCRRLDEEKKKLKLNGKSDLISRKLAADVSDLILQETLLKIYLQQPNNVKSKKLIMSGSSVSKLETSKLETSKLETSKLETSKLETPRIPKTNYEFVLPESVSIHQKLRQIASGK